MVVSQSGSPLQEHLRAMGMFRAQWKRCRQLSERGDGGRGRTDTVITGVLSGRTQKKEKRNRLRDQRFQASLQGKR